MKHLLIVHHAIPPLFQKKPWTLRLLDFILKSVGLMARQKFLRVFTTSLLQTSSCISSYLCSFYNLLDPIVFVNS
jgi:hypothetical protein